MFAKAFAAVALVSVAQAHMHLYFPPTLLGDNNPFTPEGKADPKLNYPYGCCGQTNTDICKGHLPLLDQPEGQSVVTWTAGQSANFTLSGKKIDSPVDNPVGGTHAGGSCQASLSIDKGKTFKVLKTWQGNCPPHDNMSIEPSEQVFDFTVPADVPSGDAVFAWSWINREKEFNMNCASVTIANGKGETPQQPKQPKQSEQPETEKPVEQPEEPETPVKTPKATPTGNRGHRVAQPTNAPKEQYTLEGCTCSCPYQTWSEACQCYSCDRPTTKKRDVERKALAMHKRKLQLAEKLNAPIRRAEAVAFASRPEMAFDIDIPGSACHSQGDPYEVRFINPGLDVEETPASDGYELAEPICS